MVTMELMASSFYLFVSDTDTYLPTQIPPCVFVVFVKHLVLVLLFSFLAFFYSLPCLCVSICTVLKYPLAGSRTKARNRQ